MLILSRRPGESILIGPDIQVHILKDSHGHVRVGIDAPQHVAILRSELQPHYKRGHRMAPGDCGSGGSDPDSDSGVTGVPV